MLILLKLLQKCFRQYLINWANVYSMKKKAHHENAYAKLFQPCKILLKRQWKVLIIFCWGVGKGWWTYTSYFLHVNFQCITPWQHYAYNSFAIRGGVKGEKEKRKKIILMGKVQKGPIKNFLGIGSRCYTRYWCISLVLPQIPLNDKERHVSEYK